MKTLFLVFKKKIIFSILKKNKNGNLIFFELNGKIHYFGENKNSSTPTIKILNNKFYGHCILYGEIGFGEAYVNHWWETNDLNGVLNWFIINSKTTPSFSSQKINHFFVNLLHSLNKLRHFLNHNTKSKSLENINYHYDISNKFYELMLDKTMAYSSGIFLKKNDTLEKAQTNKYEKICRKLNLNSNDHLLEIGSGWGGFAIYAAKNYNCKVTGITISKAQFEYSLQKVKKEKLQNKIEILFSDYRDVNRKYSKIVSIEMIEAIGFPYFKSFAKKLENLLSDHGIILIQCITYPESNYSKYLNNTDWTQKHIFPGSDLISIYEFIKVCSKYTNLNLYSLESLGLNYAKTLKLWKNNFYSNLSKIKKLKFDDYFIRLWNYYLSFCETSFANRYINDVQIVLSRPQNINLIDF